jgi:hypothetical protein
VFNTACILIWVGDMLEPSKLRVFLFTLLKDYLCVVRNGMISVDTHLVNQSMYICYMLQCDGVFYLICVSLQ